MMLIDGIPQQNVSITNKVWEAETDFSAKLLVKSILVLIPILLVDIDVNTDDDSD